MPASGIALVTLNPGGRETSPRHPRASCEHGSAFVAESWGAPPGRAVLQRQVRALFDGLSSRLSPTAAPDALLARSLLASLVPFRSPSFATLARRAESVAFGRASWRGLLAAATPRLVVCLGRETQRELRTLLNETGVRVRETRGLPTGWGTFDAEIDDFMGTGVATERDRATRLAYVPHLSRFAIFTSPRCRSAVDDLLDAIADGLPPPDQSSVLTTSAPLSASGISL